MRSTSKPAARSVAAMRARSSGGRTSVSAPSKPRPPAMPRLTARLRSEGVLTSATRSIAASGPGARGVAGERRERALRPPGGGERDRARQPRVVDAADLRLVGRATRAPEVVDDGQVLALDDVEHAAAGRRGEEARAEVLGRDPPDHAHRLERLGLRLARRAEHDVRPHLDAVTAADLGGAQVLLHRRTLLEQVEDALAAALEADHRPREPGLGHALHDVLEAADHVGAHLTDRKSTRLN